MSDRHEKWVRVEPGHVISAGQPYRWEHNPASDGVTRAAECVYSLDITADETAQWFIDSSWKPPLVLPTTLTWGFPMQGGCEQNVGQWMVQGNVFEDLSGTRLSVASVTDFIPLTDEQVKRIVGANR